ncbi:MAG: FkbM family methyltransferase [Rickettsiales bacterium]|jgi:FkbM family methyltransferase|nr:FkbM family methyltransferase [Rickettsiales bacterium]
MNKKLVNLMALFILKKENRHCFRNKCYSRKSISQKSLNDIGNDAIFFANDTEIKEILYRLQRAIIPNDNRYLEKMLKNAYVPEKYRFMFYEMNEDDIFIDGGMNKGLITDIALNRCAKVYAFEPNPFAAEFLKKRYYNNKNVIIEQKAIFNKNVDVEFCFHSQFDEGGSISGFMNKGKGNVFKVPTVNFSNYLQRVIKDNGKDIYMCKLDIEGAEFDVIENMIESGIYKNIKYIVCETHERAFKDGKEKMERLNKLIKDNGITNIYLDWI